MLSDLLVSIPWNTLKGAYGHTGDAPSYLEDLVYGNEDEIDEAINEFLFSTAFHQYTTYSCTPFVVRCVLYIIQNEKVDQRVLAELYEFLNACTHGAKHDLVLRSEILKGKQCYFDPSGLHSKRAQDSIFSLMEFVKLYENNSS